MKARRTWSALAALAAVILATALVATGCGSSSASSSGTIGDGAAVVPDDAAAFVAVNTDLSSGQWDQVQQLLAKFPGKDRALAMLKQSFERSSNGVTWAEVKKALGPEVDVAVFLADTKPYVVGMTQPSDEQAFASLVKNGNANGGKLVVADYKDWKIFSDTQAHLDAFEKGSGGVLSGNSNYKDASGALPGDALAKAYASGAKLLAGLKQVAPAASGQSGTIDWLAGDLSTHNDGLSLDFHAHTTGGTAAPAPYEAKLPDEIPSGVLAYLSFTGAGLETTQVKQALQRLSAIPQAAQIVQLVQALGPVFAHENALYVRQAALIPEVTLVAQPDSPAQGVAAVDRLVALLGARGGTALTPKAVTIGGVRAKQLQLGSVPLYYGAAGGKLVVSDSEAAFTELGGGGSKLSGDATFKDARTAAGMPSATNGFLYVDLKDSIPLLESLAELGSTKVPQQVIDNLKPLRSALAWATSSGGHEGSATVFLEIK
jgi:hypothetical protein